MLAKLAAVRVTVPVDDLPLFLRAAREAGWGAVDSSDRITTEGSLEGEAVVFVHLPLSAPLARL